MRFTFTSTKLRDFLIVFLSLLQLTAAQRHISSSSLLTCMENSEFSSSHFDLLFFPDNNTAIFTIDGTSVINGNIKAVFSLIVYGLNVYETEYDLCDLGYSTICPITSGKFNVQASYQISNDITNEIPGVAYTIPDLDAYIKILIYNTDANTDSDNTAPLACVKAVLSNGKTVQTRYAGWPIAIISGFGLAVSSVVSILGHSATAAHIASNSASLFIYFQTLALTSMMGVAKVPPIAASWAQNFMWSIGIIRTKFMQDMIFWYIQATGGSVTSILPNKSVISISVQKLMTKFRLFKRVSVVKSDSLDDVLNDSSLYTTDENNTDTKTLVLRGIQRVAYLSGIEISNMFMTGVIFFLFAGFVLLILASSFKAICELLVLSGVIKDSRLVSFRLHWRSIIKGCLYRLFNITFPTLMFLCIWEFTRNDSAGCMVFATFLFVISTILMVYATVKILITGSRSTNFFKNPAYLLFGDEKLLNRFGFLYVQYKASMYPWVAIHLIYLFFRSLFIAVLQNHGKVCAVIIFVIEILYCAVMIWKKPFMDKRTNLFNIFISAVNVINAIFYLFFSNVFKEPAVVSSVAAIVYFIMNAIFALVLLLFTIVTCTLAMVRKVPDAKYGFIKDDRSTFIPEIKGNKKNDEARLELAELGASAMRGQNRESILYENYSFDRGSDVFATPNQSLDSTPPSA